MAARRALNFSGHETFPLRHGWLEKMADAALARGEVPARARALDAGHAMVRFGVGKNMVNAMRHWAAVMGVAEMSPSGEVRLLPLGELLFARGADPYLENPASLWALHWRLATNAALATTWHYAFNRLRGSSFDKKGLVEELSSLVSEASAEPKSRGTLERDVDCFLRTYLVSRSKGGGFDEDSLACPLAELGLMTRGHDAYHFNVGPKPDLPDAAFAFAVAEFMTGGVDAARTLSVERATYDPGSPGRVFKLDERSVVERMERIGAAGAGLPFAWSDTAGVRQVVRKGSVAPLDILARAYGHGSRAGAAA